jgi:hypothetical protein
MEVFIEYIPGSLNLDPVLEMVNHKLNQSLVYS